MCTRAGLGKRASKRREEMKKIFNKLFKVLAFGMYTAFVCMMSYWAILGAGPNTQELSTNTRDFRCDETCVDYSGGKIPLGTKIEVKRQLLSCEYQSLTDGLLRQEYWVGPWTGTKGEDMNRLFIPFSRDEFNGDPLEEARRDKDGKPVCPDEFDLKYGQRGIHHL